MSEREQLTHEGIRAVGGIVHSDGNIFFTNLAQLNRAIDAAMQPAQRKESICTDCANADSWGLPDKRVCTRCSANSEWKPLNKGSINPWPAQRDDDWTNA